ncbi:plasmid recombination protein [Roseovarius indicus]|uniref:plasmid recombination protein n=1 Tax=Roseovarius indicus TaxID=540747 RepID=UPI0032EC4A39
MTQKHPLVYGMRPLWPGQLARVEMHQTRTGGDLSHIRPGRTHLNAFLIGDENWRERLEEDLRRASELNFRHAYSARRWTRKRKKEANEIRRNGPQDPWKRDRAEGPLREGVLTANKKHFEGDMPGFQSVEKENAFRRSALRFLQDQFGKSCVAAWEDRDEEAYHIHFVIAPWVVSESKQAGKQRRLEPSSIPVIKSYEAGHDIAAEYFAGAGLVRGEKRAQARRDAFAADGESELPTDNKTCHDWRAEEAVRLHEKRKKAAEAWIQARKKEKAAREAQKRAEALAEKNRQEEQRREKKHAARIAAVIKREAEVEKKEAVLTQHEEKVSWREQLAKFVEKAQDEFARLLFSGLDAVKAAAEKVGLKDHPLVRGGVDAVEKLRVAYRERNQDRQR